jgi:excinuclease UvrABC nuclease subunit
MTALPCNPDQQRLCDQIRAEVPSGPGVYFFEDRDSNIIYIGKSKDLRSRLLTHMRHPGADDPRRMRLHLEIRSFTLRSTPTELHALLLEDLLIKQHQPLFNKRQNEFLEQVSLVLTDETYPRLRIVQQKTELWGGRCFGPYRDKYAAAELMAIAQDHIGLRSCTTSQKSTGCIRAEIGTCSGPCTGRSTTRKYRETVRNTIDFLEGDGKAVLDKLTSQMSRCVTDERFEEAGRLRDALAFCKRFCLRQTFLLQFFRGEVSLVPRSPDLPPYRFKSGRLVSPPQPWPREDTTLADRRCLADRGILVYRWLQGQREAYSVESSPHDDAADIDG